jgi:hypothetical protein
MKKILVCFYALLFLSVVAGTSLAVPFKFTGSALDVKDPVTDSATFGVKSLGFFSGDNLSFVGPNSFAYTYNDLPGVMTLALFDISGIQWGHSVNIKGRKSNSYSAITEPATMFLMGGGLLGLALVSRRKLRK